MKGERDREREGEREGKPPDSTSVLDALPGKPYLIAKEANLVFSII